MKCPKCGSMNFDVIDSRNRTQRPYIYRVRTCLDCGHRFRTHETVVDVSDDYIKGYEQAKEDISNMIKDMGSKLNGN